MDPALGRGNLQQEATPAQAIAHLEQTLTGFTNIKQHFPKIKNNLKSRVMFPRLDAAKEELSGSTVNIFKLKSTMVPTANLLSATLTVETSKHSVVEEYMAVSGAFRGEYSVGIRNNRKNVTYIHAPDNKANVFPLCTDGFNRAADTEVKTIEAIDKYLQEMESQGIDYSSAELNMFSTYPACHSCLPTGCGFYP